MNKPIIADSSAFVSLATITDSNHKIAVEISSQIKEEFKSIIVPADVFTETTNILGKKSSHNIAIDTAQEIIQSKGIAIIETNQALRINALKRFQDQPKSVSFTDCVVMATADEYQTDEIFGFDEVYKRNGYRRFGIDK